MIRIYRRLHRAFFIAFVLFLFRGFTRFEVVGKENVPPRGPLIVISNHIHHTEPGLVPAVLGRKTYYLAKVEIMRHPIVGFIARHYDAIPLDRGGRANPDAIRKVLGLLATDQVVGMFPEGTRSRTGSMRRAKPGSALIAVKSNAPILPVAVTGTENFRWLTLAIKRPRIKVVFGEPFSLPVIEGPVGSELLQTLADMMMGRVAALLPSSYQGYYRKKEPVGEAAASGMGSG